MSALDSQTVDSLADDVIRWKLGTIGRSDVEYVLEGADAFQGLTDDEYKAALAEITETAERKAGEIGDDI